MASSNSSNSSRDDPFSFSSPSTSPIPVSDAADSFLADQNSQIGSASGSFQNDGLLSAGGGDGGSDVEFGFLRPEFRQGPLVGTMQIYEGVFGRALDVVLDGIRRVTPRPTIPSAVWDGGMCLALVNSA